MDHKKSVYDKVVGLTEDVVWLSADTRYGSLCDRSQIRQALSGGGAE